ncbi:MAG: hypothetical protein P1U82_24300 [Verrucomicrobiales bacterium]|nr:hypothetical protein [Verrucomicrobiales bacterium]
MMIPTLAFLVIMTSCEPKMEWIASPLTESIGPEQAEVGFDGFQFYLRDSEISQQDALMRSEYPMVGPAWGADQTEDDQFFIISPFNESGTRDVTVTASTTPPSPKTYNFLGCLPFRVTSGVVSVDGYDEYDRITFEIPPGHYSCYVGFYSPHKVDIHFCTIKAETFGDVTPNPRS